MFGSITRTLHMGDLINDNETYASFFDYSFSKYKYCACSSQRNSHINITGLKNSYSDNELIEFNIKNISNKKIFVTIIYEENVNGKWKSLLTKNKAVRIIDLKKNEEFNNKWIYWENDFTFEKTIATGQYRVTFWVKDKRMSRNILEKTSTHEFQINREEIDLRSLVE